MSERKQRRWQYAGSAGSRDSNRKEDRLPLAPPLARSSGQQSKPARPKRPRQARRGEQTGRRGQHPGLRDILLWTAVAIVAGGFLALLARQMWLLGLAAAVLVAVFLWRGLR